MTPFNAVLAHRDLAAHVRNVGESTATYLARHLLQLVASEICVVPLLCKSRSNPTPHPQFLLDSIAALMAAKNMTSFVCTVPQIVPSYLSPLQDRRRLESLRINADLTTDQTAQLLRLTGLKSISLESASWTVVDALPKWAESLKSTLLHLTIRVSSTDC